MLIDGQIRNRLVSLADTVEEAALDDALRTVVQGATARRKRELATRAAVSATALCVAAVALGWGGPSAVDVVEPVPADRVAPIESEPKFEVQPGDPRRPKEDRRRVGSRAGAGERTSTRLKEGKNQRGRNEELVTVPGTTSTSGDSSNTADGATDAPQPAGEESGTSSLRFEETRSDDTTYGPSFVSVNPDRRSGCSLDGQGCASFPVRSDDAFASVSVADEVGSVFVRITQWDRHGRRVGEALTFCGGNSQTFALAPDIGHISVSVEKGVCGGEQTTPAGGRIQISFLKQVT